MIAAIALATALLSPAECAGLIDAGLAAGANFLEVAAVCQETPVGELVERLQGGAPSRYAAPDVPVAPGQPTIFQTHRGGWPLGDAYQP